MSGSIAGSRRTTSTQWPWVKGILLVVGLAAAVAVVWFAWNRGLVTKWKEEARPLPFFAGMTIAPAIGFPIAVRFQNSFIASSNRFTYSLRMKAAAVGETANELFPRAIRITQPRFECCFESPTCPPRAGTSRTPREATKLWTTCDQSRDTGADRTVLAQSRCRCLKFEQGHDLHRAT
jgi:hypothetical protein